jgi:hypothetical protein
MPDPSNLALDWGTIDFTTWAVDCVVILSHEFNLNLQQGAFPPFSTSHPL